MPEEKKRGGEAGKARALPAGKKGPGQPGGKGQGEMKQGILVVSFGAAAGTRERTIGAIEAEAAARRPGAVVSRAYTSPTIRRKLAEGEGFSADSLPEALRRMEEAGVEELGVLPTYVMPGLEHQRLLEACREARGRFGRLRAADPLLGSARDLRAVAGILADCHPGLGEGEALVLMGHGTSHPGDFAYPALEYALRDRGMGRAFVATVEGWPDFGCLLRRLEEAKVRRVILRPLMTTAGTHVREDMMGEGPDSWRSRLLAAGYRVDCLPQGLAELPAIRELFLSHLDEALAGE